LKKLEFTTITQKVIIPNVSPKQVYDAYVDPKKQEEFTDSKATGKPTVNGKFTAWDGYIFGKFLLLEDGKHLIQEWTTTDWEEGYPASKLELTFAKVSDGTEICLLHSNVPKAQAYEIEEGWTEFYWNPLKEYFKNE
jgi:activator of HSP90 ATPase